jgi:hypothetical protein
VGFPPLSGDLPQKNSNSREVLDNWYKIASKANCSNLLKVQSVFLTAKVVGNFTVFKAVSPSVTTMAADS